MSDCEDAVSEFVTAAETIYDEYEDGYIDADAALRRLRPEITELESTVE